MLEANLVHSPKGIHLACDVAYTLTLNYLCRNRETV